jgi:hypothetical protein
MGPGKEAEVMTLELNDQERDFLLETLTTALREKEHELHHTYSSEFKRYLQRRITLIEKLKSKLLLAQVG